MKRYLHIYRQLLRMNAMVLTVYPSNFVNSMIATIGWGCFSLFSVVILTSRVSGMFGWTKNEILLLNGYYGLIVGLFHVLCSRNLERFSWIVHRGDLDSILAKPIDPQFALSFWMFSYTSITRIIIAASYIWYMARIMDLPFDFVRAFEFGVVGIASIVLLYSIWFMMITITIWFSKLSNIAELLYSMTGMARYPQEMYSQMVWYVFIFLFPLTLTITIPAKIFLARGTWFEAGLLFVLSALFLMISRKFFRFALRHYASASS